MIAVSNGENLRPERGGFTLREVAQSALEPTQLGEFIEVVVRVPIDRHSSAQAVMGVPDEHGHEEIASWIGEEYPSPCGFIADWWDQPGSQVAVRVRARQGQDMLRDTMVKIWEGGKGGTGTATE